jgi:hypothetical protein
VISLPDDSPGASEVVPTVWEFEIRSANATATNALVLATFSSSSRIADHERDTPA